MVVFTGEPSLKKQPGHGFHAGSRELGLLAETCKLPSYLVQTV